MRRAFLASLLLSLLVACVASLDPECHRRTCEEIVAEARALGDEPRCGLFADGCGAEVRCGAADVCAEGLTCNEALAQSSCAPPSEPARCETSPCGAVIDATGEVCLQNCLRWEPDADPRAPNSPLLPGGRSEQLLVPELDADGMQLGLLAIGGREYREAEDKLSSWYVQSPEVWRLRLDADGRLFGELLPVEPPPPPAESWIGGAGPGEVVFGLGQASGALHPSVYRLDLATLRLEELVPADGCGAPPGCPSNERAAGTYDPSSRTLWLFGGDPTDGRRETDELWAFDVASRRWSLRSYPGDGRPWPMARTEASAVWHPGLGQFALFGGASYACRCPDPEDGLPPVCEPAVRCEDVWNGRLLEGCGGHPACFASRVLRYGDLWFFDPGTERWTPAPPAVELAPRAGAGIAWDPARAAIVVAAGRGPSEGFEQTCAPPASRLPGTTLLDHFNLGDTWFFVDGGQPERGSWLKLRVEEAGDPDARRGWSQCLDLAVDGRVAPLPDGTLLQMGGQLSDILGPGFVEPLVTRFQRLYGRLP